MDKAAFAKWLAGIGLLDAPQRKRTVRKLALAAAADPIAGPQPALADPVLRGEVAPPARSPRRPRPRATKSCYRRSGGFGWRHRFLSALTLDQPSQLSGIIEADETFILESFKGKRSDLPRAGRTRGGKAITAFARRARVTFHVLPAPGGPKPQAPELHINNVNAYHGRLKEWLARFYGVATKNLPSYLSWRRTIEALLAASTPQARIMGAVGLGPYQQSS
jgi:hypothetical protein